MAISINVNGTTIDYPETGDTNWSDEATNFAVQTSSALGKIGLSSGTSVDVAGALDVTGAATLDSTLTVAGTTTLNGTANLNGNVNLGNAIGDTTAISGNTTIGGTLGVTGNATIPEVVLDNVQATGSAGVTIENNSSTDVAIFGAGGGTGTSLLGGLNVNGSTTLGDASGDSLTINGTAVSVPNGLNIDSNTLVIDSTNDRVGIKTASPTVELDVTGAILSSGNITTAGVLTASNSTNVTTAPPITFTGDTNTGIGHSAADTLDFVTKGNSRFRIESTGQIKAVYESQVGTDYNTQLDNGYLCRAWVNFNGTGTVAIRASGNVSSITDNGTGAYTVNFTNAMPDANYACVGSANLDGSGQGLVLVSTTPNIGSIAIATYFSGVGAQDKSSINLVVFR